jgi:hypothetical protein
MNDAGGEQFLVDTVDAINSARDEAGNRLFVALVDREMERGEYWRGVLYNWMLLCDAAVVLIDGGSTRSTWVPREAMVFRWRKELDPSFHLLLVLRGVGKNILKQPPFCEMGLDDLNYEETVDPGAVVGALRRIAMPSCDIRLAELAQHLGVTPSNPQRFDPVKDLLDLRIHPFLAAFAAERAVAASLLGFGFREQPRKNGPFNPCAQALWQFSRWLEQGKLCQIFETVCTYWVDRAAAAGLFRGFEQHRVVAVRVHVERDDWAQRAVTDHMGQAYSQKPRVCQLKHIEPVTRTAGMADEFSYARARVRTVLWHLMHRPGEPGDADQASIDATFRRRDDLFLWAAETDQIRLEHLVQVQRQMPYLRVLYLYASDSCRGAPGVHYVEPEMDESTETAASVEIDTAYTYIGDKL